MLRVSAVSQVFIILFLLYLLDL